MTDDQSTLANFLDAVAARQPTPGGGAVAAAVGALACAIGEMTLNYSVGKKGLEPQQAELTDALAQMHRARRLFIQLLLEDQLAYDALSTANKSSDASAKSAALLTAIRVPQGIASTAAAVLEQARRVAPIANRWLLSDLAVCVELAMATVRAAVCNVRVNLGQVTDPAERSKLTRWAEDITARSVEIVRETMPRIWQRIES